jgi:hypothetical protein
MTISKDLFMSILSMDAYNRGYGAGINANPDSPGLGELSDGSVQIGWATVSKNLADAGLLARATTEGFYAIAYTLEEAVGEDSDQIADGTTIISYRGTEGMRKGRSGLYH